jgi:hypothetical protein
LFLIFGRQACVEGFGCKQDASKMQARCEQDASKQHATAACQYMQPTAACQYQFKHISDTCAEKGSPQPTASLLFHCFELIHQLNQSFLNKYIKPAATRSSIFWRLNLRVCRA